MDRRLDVSPGFLNRITDNSATKIVRQFRASPDLLKTLPKGVGAVLVAHGGVRALS